LKAEGLSHSGKGDFTAAVFDYTSSTSIESLTLTQGIINYLKNVRLTFDSKLHIDQQEQKYAFTKNKLTINELGLLFDGFVQMNAPGKTAMDIRFKADKTDFKSLLSLIPAIYAKDFEALQTTGNLQLEGMAKGILEGESYPAFDLAVKVDNGKFQYPKLPTAVSNIFLNAQVKNPGGNLDNTVITVPDLRLTIASEPITARLNITTPVSDPNIDLSAKGKINLADVQRFYPIEGVKTLKGNASVDLSLKAKQSDAEAKRYQQIHATGTIHANGIEYVSTDVPKPLSVSDLQLNFSPQYLDVSKCIAKIGNSDFDITGKLENIIGYILSKDGVITGNVNIVSGKIDANEFLPDSTASKKSKAQQAKEAVRLPKNIALTGNATINELLYDKLVIKNLAGKFNLQQEQLNLNNLTANLLGGSATVSGYYNTKTDIPTGNLTYTIQNFDIQQVYTYLGVMRQAAPIMKYVTGNFGSDMNMQMTLHPDMSPDLNSLNGTAGFKMPLANVKGVPALQKIVEQTKLKQLENLRIENLDIKTTVANGRIIVDPFETKVNNLKMTIGGSQGIDQTMDYTVAIDVPWKELGQASSFAQGLLAKNPIPGLNNMVPEVIRINLKVGGTFTKPEIKMGKPDAAAKGTTLKDEVKEQMKEQTEQLKEEVKQQVKAQTDSLKNQLKEQAQSQLQNILSGNQQGSDSATAKPVIPLQKDSIKKSLKNLLPWQR
jgi:hypothetical protein